jgi:hypothetical protein
LSPDETLCHTHRGDAKWIESDSLQRCRDMSKLVQRIKLRMQQPAEQQRRQAVGLYPYIRRLYGPHKYGI